MNVRYFFKYNLVTLLLLKKIVRKATVGKKRKTNWMQTYIIILNIQLRICDVIFWMKLKMLLNQVLDTRSNKWKKKYFYYMLELTIIQLNETFHVFNL